MAIHEGVLDRTAIQSLVGLSATDPIGFYGTTAVAQQTIAANGTDAATTQALANDLKAKLKALGLVV
jgi:hypothetical protein